LADAPEIVATSLTIPDVYFNSLILSLSNADVNMTLMVDNQPQMRLHFSFTTAKTLQKYIGEAIAKLESVTGHEIMIVPEVEAGLVRMREDMAKQ
jgi:hypothetical protein